MRLEGPQGCWKLFRTFDELNFAEEKVSILSENCVVDGPVGRPLIVLNDFLRYLQKNLLALYFSLKSASHLNHNPTSTIDFMVIYIYYFF